MRGNGRAFGELAEYALPALAVDRHAERKRTGARVPARKIAPTVSRSERASRCSPLGTTMTGHLNRRHRRYRHASAGAPSVHAANSDGATLPVPSARAVPTARAQS